MPGGAAVYARALESVVKEVTKTYPVLLVTGPRQVGETTLLERMTEDERKHVSLDDPAARQLAKEEPLLFLQRYEPPVVDDEIQDSPELLPYIKVHAVKNTQDGDFSLGS